MQLNISAMGATFLSVFALDPAIKELKERARNYETLKEKVSGMSQRNHYQEALEELIELNNQIEFKVNTMMEEFNKEVKAYHENQQ